MKDYYEILEVNEKASREVINKAYKVLVQKYHPDKYQGDARKIVEDRLRDVNEAYQIISDDFLREQYDKERAKDKNDIKIKTIYDNKEENKIDNNYQEEKIDTQKKKKKVKSKIGTMAGLADVTKQVFENLPKIPKEKPKFTKKGVLSFIVAVAIVLLFGAILWFIPFTNEFMKSFLLIN